ncbi:unnamed protein product [Malus baccata var. baccata]
MEASYASHEFFPFCCVGSSPPCLCSFCGLNSEQKRKKIISSTLKNKCRFMAPKVGICTFKFVVMHPSFRWKNNMWLLLSFLDCFVLLLQSLPSLFSVSSLAVADAYL